MHLLFLLLGCGGGPAVGCDFRDGSVNGPESRCQERQGTQAAGFDAFCESLGGEAVDGGCPTEGIVGGCADDFGAAGAVIDWYYAPETAETVQATCDEDGTTFVEG